MDISSLVDLLKPEVSYAPVQLASGESADWYVDCRVATYGQRSGAVTGAVVRVLDEAALYPTALGGVGYGGLPTAVQVASLLDRRSFAVRAEPKPHGGGGCIVGPLEPHDRVVLIEDVITSGASVAAAIKEVHKVRAQVMAVVCLVNRSSPWVHTIEGIPVISLLRPIDLGVG